MGAATRGKILQLMQVATKENLSAVFLKALDLQMVGFSQLQDSVRVVFSFEQGGEVGGRELKVDEHLVAVLAGDMPTDRVQVFDSDVVLGVGPKVAHFYRCHLVQ